MPRAPEPPAGDAAAGDAVFEATLNSIGDAVLSTDLAGHVTYLNPVAETMTGWSKAEAAGRPLTDVFHVVDGSTRDRVPNPVEQAVRRNKTVGLPENCLLISRNGHESAIEDSTAPIRDSRGRIAGAVIVFHDVSAARRASMRLAHLAQHDFLTDLPNRMLVIDRLQQAIALARRSSRRIGVLFVDLDEFKQVNDSLGHLVGDAVLKEVALRLRAVVRQSDTVGRQSGDEFVVVLSELETTASAGVIACKLHEALGAPHQIGLHTVRVPASIGISIYPDHALDAETLLTHADAAMYKAKEDGRRSRATRIHG